MSQAGDLIRRFADRRPLAVRLAEAVSLAVLVDPPLLRRARRLFVPEADAGTEADLWLSPLVRARSPQGISFPPEVAQELRRRLRSSGRLDDAWEMTCELHGHLPPALQIEEEIAWLSVSEDPGAADRIEELLRSALAALVAGERRGLAHWVAQALPRLPSGVRFRSTTQMLEAGAHLRMGGDAGPLKQKESIGQSPGETPEWASWVAPADLPRVPVRVRLLEGAVELDAGVTEGNLRLPQTDPLMVDLSWEEPDGDGERSVQVTFRKGKAETVPVPVREARLRTLLGEVYDLRAAGMPAPDLREWILDFSDERARHEPLFGREEDLARLDELARSGHGIVILQGPVGAGKTALLARFLKLREDRGMPTPHHFFRRGDPRRESGFWAERSLAAQIAAVAPELASAAAHQDLSQVLVHAARGRSPGSEPLVLVLDGLEEERGGGLLRRLFPQEVPDGIVVIVSIPTKIWLPEIPEPAEWLSLSDPDPALRKYWSRWDFYSEFRPETGEAIVLRSAGSFGVAAVLKSWMWRESPERPEGEDPSSPYLETLWADTVASLGEEVTETGLGALAAARGPLPEQFLEERLGVEPASKLIQRLRFLLRGSGSEDVQSWELEQDVVRELVLEKLQARIYGIHEDLARITTFYILPKLRLYGLKNGVAHWMAGGKPEEAYRLLKSLSFLVSKCREIGIEAVLEDCQEWLGSPSTRQWLDREESRSLFVEASKQEDPEARIRDILALLTEEEQRLRKDPEALSGMLYNRLLQQGMAPEAIRNLPGLSPAPPALRLNRPLDRDRPLQREASRRHRDAITGCTMAEVNGDRTVVSWSEDGTLKVWDIVSGELRATLTGHRSAVTGCAVFFPNRVIASSRNGSLRTWSLSESEPVHALHGHEGEGLGVAVAADGERAVSWSADRTIRVWDLEEGRELHVLRGHEAAVTACAVTPDFRYVVSGSADATVRIWNLASGELLRTWRGHAGPITGVELDGYRIISASRDGALKVWSRSWHEEEARSPVNLKGPPGGLLGCTISGSGSALAAWSQDRKIRVWNLAAIHDDAEEVVNDPPAAPPVLLEGHQGDILGCAFYPDGDRLASCSADGTVRIWDAETGENLSILQGHRRAVRSIALDSERVRGLQVAEMIVSGSDDRTLRVWGAQDGTEQAVLDGDNETLFCLGLGDRRRVVTWSRLGDLRLYNLETSLPDMLASPSMIVGGATLAPDDRGVVLWSRNLVDGQSQFTVWNFFSLLRIAAFSGHSSPVLACTIAPDSRLISAHLDGTVEIRHLDRVEEVSSLRFGSGAPVADLAVTPNGSHLLCATWDGNLWLREITGSWETARILSGHTDRVLACAIHPSGGTAVSASADRTLRLWYYSQGHTIAVLSGHDDEVTGCAFTPDGSRVISRSLDGTLGIWDVETGALLFRLRGHTDWVNAFALDEDRNVLYSCSEDETVRAWDLATGDQRGVVYGISPFRSLAVTYDGVCAGDEAGNFWVLEYGGGELREGVTPGPSELPPPVSPQPR